MSDDTPIEGTETIESAEPHAPAPEDQEIETEVAELLQSPEDKDRAKVKAALIARTKELRAQTRRVKELEPIASESAALKANLSRVTPIVDAILNNPRLKAEALRMANGGAPAEPEAAPADQRELVEFAQDQGLYLSDGMTPDTDRAQRMIARQAKMVQSIVQEVVRPLGQAYLGDKADQNIQRVMQMTDDDGLPWATRESVEETVRAMGMDPNGRQLLANPQVAEIVLNNAIGLDRRRGRTPKRPEEPVFLEQAGSGGRQRLQQSYTPDDKRAMQKLGLEEKDLEFAAKAIAKSSRLGRALE